MTQGAPPGRRALPRPGLRSLVAGASATAAILLLRLWIAVRISYCGNPDSCSYLALGESLSRHRGFVENFLYQYQLIDVRLPQHGVEYWRPGTSFLLLLAQPFGGVTLHSSLVVTILAGVLLAGAAWHIASHAPLNPGSGQTRSLACLSFALCLALPPLWENSTSPDSALFYGAFVAWALALFRVRFQGYAHDLLAWVCLVFVNLIRNDTILLLPSVLTVLWLRRRQAGTRGATWSYSAIVLAGFTAALLPMHAIRHAVLGSWQSTNPLAPLYLINLSDLLDYGQPLTLHSALAVGASRLVKMRVVTTATILRDLFLTAGFGAILVPGLWLSRRTPSKPAIPTPPTLLPEWQGGAVFALVTLAAYGLVLPAIGVFSALRTWNGLLPLAAVLMVAGALGYTSSLRAAKLLGWSAVAFYLVLGFMEANRSIAEKNQDGYQTRTVARYLAAHGANPADKPLVMTANAAQFSETTSYPAVPIPSNGLHAIAEAVHDLAPRYVLLNTDANHPSPWEPSVIATLKPLSAVQVPDTEIMVLTLR